MNVVYCFSDSASEWNTSEWRGHIPSNGLNTHPDHQGRMIPISDLIHFTNDNVQAVLGPADVIVVQRNLLAKEIWEACDYWRGLGKIVVADLDDDYPNLTPQNPAYNFWILDKTGLKEKTGYSPVEALTEGFRHVDALVSPNRKIIEDWSEIVDGYWLPNYAHWPWYENIEQKSLDHDNIIIGWGGSVSHWDSFWFSGLREALPIVFDYYPNATFKFCGGDIRLKKMFDDIIPGRWFHQPGVPPDQWPLQVASFDIGTAPLCGPGYPQGERYDQRRSWLKAVEYTLTGVPWVASNGGVYDELDGKGGFVVPNTAEAWIEKLCETIDDLKERKRESKKLMSWARDNLAMEKAVDKYIRTLYEISMDKNARDGIRLPNIIYTQDLEQSTEEIERVEIELLDDDLEGLLALQRQIFHTSKIWHEGITVEYNDVDLTDCLQYPILQILNREVSQ